MAPEAAKMLFTIDFEYRGGTYLAQVEAPGPTEALAVWLQRISDEEAKSWKTGRAALLSAFGNCDAPVPVDGLAGVWCQSCSVGGAFALVNIVTTARVKPPVQRDFTSTEWTLLQNALNEVCNGIALEGEFETRIGASLEEARSLLGRLKYRIP